MFITTYHKTSQTLLHTGYNMSLTAVCMCHLVQMCIMVLYEKNLNCITCEKFERQRNGMKLENCDGWLHPINCCIRKLHVYLVLR